MSNVIGFLFALFLVFFGIGASVKAALTIDGTLGLLALIACSALSAFGTLIVIAGLLLLCEDKTQNEDK